MMPIEPKLAMNPIDLRTELEAIEAQLKFATTDAEHRTLNAKRRTIEKKMLKVQKREEHITGHKGRKS